VLAARGDSGVATGRIHEYLDRLRGVRTRVSGRDLAALGLSPGPRYREVLERLLAARLDGEVATREEELALARRLVGDAAWAP
jgi:tRNA nucleotidyltransferase (CCA-adding enzyme)